jgi:hypothetical protein
VSPASLSKRLDGVRVLDFTRVFDVPLDEGLGVEPDGIDAPGVDAPGVDEWAEVGES